MAIQQLRHNRAPGKDGIPAEIYKMHLDFLGPWLHRVICKVWSCETAPSIILPLFKGDR